MSGDRLSHRDFGAADSPRGTRLSRDPLRAHRAFGWAELRRLRARFKKIDTDASGTISVDELLALPNMSENPLVQRVVDVFDRNGDGELDLTEFIDGLAQFADRKSRARKLAFAFRVYDIDKDGFISNGELFAVLKKMVGENLHDTQLQQIVDKTIMIHDKDGDGKIGFAEFCAVVGNIDFEEKLVLGKV